MRMRSTGLGKTELIGRVEDLHRREDYVVLSVRTTEPVRWHVRVAMDYRDIMKVLKCLFKLSIIAFLFPSRRRVKQPREIVDY